MIKNNYRLILDANVYNAWNSYSKNYQNRPLTKQFTENNKNYWNSIFAPEQSQNASNE